MLIPAMPQVIAGPVVLPPPHYALTVGDALGVTCRPLPVTTLFNILYKPFPGNHILKQILKQTAVFNRN